MLKSMYTKNGHVLPGGKKGMAEMINWLHSALQRYHRRFTEKSLKYDEMAVLIANTNKAKDTYLRENPASAAILGSANGKSNNWHPRTN